MRISNLFQRHKLVGIKSSRDCRYSCRQSGSKLNWFQRYFWYNRLGDHRCNRINNRC